MLERLKASFNSTLVQLKDYLDMPAAYVKNCFNSTLVQLKEGYGVNL